MNEIAFTSEFKRQYKKVSRGAQWRKVFNRTLPKEIDAEERTPWEYIKNCFTNNEPIDDYFYPHRIETDKHAAKLLKNVEAQTGLKDLKVSWLHFDGHNGNHLLEYVVTPSLIYLSRIGTHNDLMS